jgi:hypothetical protein
MVKKPTWILLGIMVLLAVFAIFSQKIPALQNFNTTPTPTSMSSLLVDYKLEDTRLVKFENPGGQSISLRMGKDFKTWSVDQNTDAPIDAGKVMQVLTGLQSLRPVSKLESSSDENAMGIGAGSKKLTLVVESGSTTEIILGDKTATSSGYYIKVGGAIYIVETFAVNDVIDLLTMDSLVKKTETPTAPITATQQP